MVSYRVDRCSRVEFLAIWYLGRGYDGPVTTGYTRWRSDACAKVLA